MQWTSKGIANTTKAIKRKRTLDDMKADHKDVCEQNLQLTKQLKNQLGASKQALVEIEKAKRQTANVLQEIYADVQRLQAALQERDAEVQRLRAELQQGDVMVQSIKKVCDGESHGTTTALPLATSPTGTVSNTVLDLRLVTLQGQEVVTGIAVSVDLKYARGPLGAVGARPDARLRGIVKKWANKSKAHLNITWEDKNGGSVEHCRDDREDGNFLLNEDNDFRLESFPDGRPAPVAPATAGDAVLIPATNLKTGCPADDGLRVDTSFRRKTRSRHHTDSGH